MKHTVTIRLLDNRRCSVFGLDSKITRLLDEALAIEVQGAQFQASVRRGLWDGKRHLFSKKTNTFPHGLLSRVVSFLEDLKLYVKIRDKRAKHIPKPDLSLVHKNMLKGDITLRPYQLKAIRRGLKRQRGIFWLATNSGKTEVSAAIIKTLINHRTLFLVHKQALLDQARARIALRLGTIEEHIGVIGAGRFDPKHITVATIQTLSRKMHPKKRRLIQAYFNTIGQLHIDEGHHSKATTWYKLINRIDAQFRFIYSGTPFGSGNGLMVEACTGPIIHRVTNDELIKLGVSAKPTIEIIQCEKPVLANDLSWVDVYQQGIVENDARNALIAKRAHKFTKARLKTMILVTHLRHGDLINQHLDALSIAYEFAHGRMPRSAQRDAVARFEHGNIDVLVASPIFDEGVDMPAIRALIVADGGKSVRAALQKIGRGLRKKEGVNALAVVDFADMSHKWLARHSQDRISIYENEGFKLK